MKASRLIPLIASIVMISGASLLAQTPTYIFLPYTGYSGNTAYNGQIVLDAPANLHGTSADVVSWYISDPSGVLTPQNSTLSTTGFVDWNTTGLIAMGLTFDTNGVAAVGITQTNIYEAPAPLQPIQNVGFGVWRDNVPETSSTFAMLLLASVGLGVYHFHTIRKKA